MGADEMAAVPIEAEAQDSPDRYYACWEDLKAELWSTIEKDGFRQLAEALRRRDHNVVQQAALQMTNIAGVIGRMAQIEQCGR